MKVFVLTRHSAPPHYDCINRMVVVAEHEGAARHMAAGQAADEGPAAWLDERRSTCERADLKTPDVLCKEGRDG